MNAKKILELKDNKIYQIREEAVVFEAIEELTKNKVGLLIVNNSNGDISGVISERDIIQKCVYQKKDPLHMKVSEIMTPREKIVVAAEEDDIQSLMNTMNEKRIRHLPVFRGKEMTGVISIGDIIKNMLEIKDYEIKSLIEYISGKYPR
ncbi:MAG: CBS domain-containing protein [Bacteroidota bacterium]|nr:CBS domain-containing protein [Bacteroidota bacterium]